MFISKRGEGQGRLVTQGGEEGARYILEAQPEVPRCPARSVLLTALPTRLVFGH